MSSPSNRRCVIEVSPAILHAAEELADLLGVGVGEFIEFVVKDLHEREAQEGALRRAHDERSAVIPLDQQRRRQRQRRG